jgi:archaemetzincin
MTPPPGSDVGEIHLLPVGAPSTEVVAAVAAGVSRRLSVPCRVRPARSAAPPFLVGRDQVDADGLLASLDADLAPGTVLVGLTALDMGIPIFSFVFGRARTDGRTAVVSLARLDPVFYGLPPAPHVLLSRSEAEVVHELGHVAGLPHCRDPRCLMNFAGNVERADARGSAFCSACARLLPAWLKASA